MSLCCTQTYDPVFSEGFYRDPENRVVAGVCSGLAQHFGFSICAVRFVAVLLLCAGTLATLAVYLAAAMIMQPAPTARRCRASVAPNQSGPVRPTRRRSAEILDRFKHLEARLIDLERRAVDHQRDDLKRSIDAL